MSSSFLRGAVTTLFVGLSFVALAQRQAIADWWYLRNYTPTPLIESYVEQGGFNDRGRDLFYLSDPTLLSSDNFRSFCEFSEATIVLGCYDGVNIFILDVDEPQLEGIEIVTAAHEMLHAAYDRLSSGEKAQINKWLNAQFKTVKNQRVLDVIEEYRGLDSSTLANELHSILPTELKKLNPVLEDYYAMYFDDRKKVVAAAEEYADVFVEIDNRIENFDRRLENIESQFKSLEAQLLQSEQFLINERARLESLLADNRISEYNAAVGDFNRTVNQHNSQLQEVESLISSYNMLVRQRNEIALEQNDLLNSLKTTIKSF